MSAVAHIFFFSALFASLGYAYGRLIEREAGLGFVAMMVAMPIAVISGTMLLIGAVLQNL